ncbi:hypothetical protein KPH14_012706 [Odynerus spinipes]|uniref:RNA-directed DNA polymerase n=1 Tax=Odynerus spinipes TaxID=1348599 RepID=A0AAD9VKX7_9HYME|nr:hypothetical protein KPH14_012706 [Odynerus spinipes]
MHVEIEALTRQVAALTSSVDTQMRRGRSKSCNRSRDRYPRSRSKSQSQRVTGGQCYYHRRFGARALKYRTTGWTFLVDTGADVSILPVGILQYKPAPTTSLLYAVDGNRVRTYGKKHLTLNLGLRRPIRGQFIIAGVTNPVIGADILKEHGLIVDLQGHEISEAGTKPLLERVRAIQEFPKPKTLIQLRRFLGKINYYRRFVKNAARSQALLNAFLKESKRNDKRPVPWTEASSKAFALCKKELAEATLLAHPKESAPLLLLTDASDLAIDDIKCSVAELLYGTPLRVPGEFFEDVDYTVELEMVVQEFCNRARKVRAQPTTHYTRRNSFVHQSLQHASHVFVRDDAQRKPLQQPYTGPHKIVERRNERVFVVQMDRKDIVVSTERLKPAYLPADDTPPEEETLETALIQPPPIRTYPGRLGSKRVKFRA